MNSNIVNVAVTRAKYRLYIVGDADVWKNNKYVYTAKQEMERDEADIPIDALDEKV